MASHYSKLSAICLFAVLQCFAPLLHAHFDTKTHGSSDVHQHDVVELYCLDTSPCPEAKVESLNSPAITTTALVFPKKFSPPPDPAILPGNFSPKQSQTRISVVAIPLPGINIPRLPFISPLAHAPPVIL